MASREEKGSAVRTRRSANKAARGGDAAESAVTYAPEDDVLAAADRIAERDSELLRRLAQ